MGQLLVQAFYFYFISLFNKCVINDQYVMWLTFKSNSVFDYTLFYGVLVTE